MRAKELPHLPRGVDAVARRAEEPLRHPHAAGPGVAAAVERVEHDGGMWQGRRIVSEDFAKRSTSALYNLRKIYYGYLWWIEDYPYKDRTVRIFSARGAGGQTVTVVPELGLIVGTFAGSYFSRKGMFAASTDPIARIILPAVREAGDDKNAPVVEREYISPYGASKDGSRIAPKP